MKAFLSHSSKDKGFISALVDCLRPGTYELDDQTFDSGLLNSEAILSSLQRCELFCLFLSKDSIESRYVDFETSLGIELLAQGKISRILVICIDDLSFDHLSTTIRFINILRKRPSPEAAARLIEGTLLTATSALSLQHHPFIGREGELTALIRQISDFNRPASKALFLSGNFGSGRRTLGQQFYKTNFPQVGPIFPSIGIEYFTGLEELYRTILTTLHPTMSVRSLLVRAQSFEVASLTEKQRLIAQLINNLFVDREAAFVIDKGGLLTDSGALIPEIDSALNHIQAKPYPPIVFISPRMIPRSARRTTDDLSYLPVRSLNRDAASLIISTVALTKNIGLNNDTLDKLVSLSDSLPLNIYRMMDEISDCGIDAFIANPAPFVEWKHRRSSEYVGNIKFSDIEAKVLSILKLIPELDFASIVEAGGIESNDLSTAILRLLNLHILESSNGNFLISPPLRIAVERDRRFSMPKEFESSAVRRIAESLPLRIEANLAPVVLVNSAILASLQGGVNLPRVTAGLLLPSHYVWMAKKNYDDRSWSESIRYARLASEGRDRLSSEGLVAAYRYMCLAAARTGDEKTFSEGLKELRAAAGDDWAYSNVNFLQGFNARLKGYVPEAEKFFRRAYELSPGNHSAAREIASVCLDRGDLEESERYVREAREHAARNPYLIDILVAILIRKHGRGRQMSAELTELFDLLSQVGESGGRSFFTTRRAEFEHLWGDNREALQLIERAVARTPRLFEPRRLHAEILLKAGNLVKAQEVIRVMRGMVRLEVVGDRRKNYRQYIQTRAQYLIEVGRFDEAKEIFRDGRIFSAKERDEKTREIEVAQGYRAAQNR